MNADWVYNFGAAAFLAFGVANIRGTNLSPLVRVDAEILPHADWTRNATGLGSEIENREIIIRRSQRHATRPDA